MPGVLSLPLIVLFVLFALAVAAAAEITVEPAAQLQADLNAAVHNGSTSFSIPSGTYRFQNADLLVDAAQSLDITGPSSSDAKAKPEAAAKPHARTDNDLGGPRLRRLVR